YGIRNAGAAISSAPRPTRSANRTSWSWVPKCTVRAYAAPTLLRMCGICGVVSASGSVDLERVARMSATLVHRGPDSAGEFADGTAALAARRLSIIDLETGDQPIANEDGTLHVVQNGEIYNYREAGTELAFASELRALPRGEIDLDALEAFLAFNSIPAPLTIFREARKLPAGHLLCWEDGAVRLERFARPAPLPERDDEQAELVEELRSRLRDSVRAHLVSDVPVRVPLPGGF